MGGFEYQGSGIGYAGSAGIGAIGMLGTWHRFSKYAGGRGIALRWGFLNANAVDIEYAGGLAQVLYEYVEESGIGSICMPRDPHCVSFHSSINDDFCYNLIGVVSV